MSPEILNPESKVGTLNPTTFESGEFSRVNDFFANPDIFRLRYFEFAVDRKWRITLFTRSRIVGTLMTISGCHYRADYLVVLQV